MRFSALLGLIALGACSVVEPEITSPTSSRSLPAMKLFSTPDVTPPQRPNYQMVADILDLSFLLESGRELPVLTRFETPITLRVIGETPPPTLERDLSALLTRIRREAGIDVTRVENAQPASITIEVISRRTLSRNVPNAACFVVPGVSNWQEFRASRRSPRVDWAALDQRQTLAVFLPGDVSGQEVRDCLHEEIAQAIGPLNDLYRLPDSVFNDDNFHSVLTGFDMLVLRVLYDPALSSGMTREQVAQRLPAILDRLNPRGRGGSGPPPQRTTQSWIKSVEAAIGARASESRRLDAAESAVRQAEEAEWRDVRTGFSYFILGRLTLATDLEIALGSYLIAGGIFNENPTMQIQTANVAMQLAAVALASGQPEAAIEISDRHIPAVIAAENARLLASFLFIKSESYDVLGRTDQAQIIREDALGWGLYGFDSVDQLRQREAEIAALRPREITQDGAS